MAAHTQRTPLRFLAALLLSLLLMVALAATAFIKPGVWLPTLLQPSQDWTTTSTNDIFHFRAFQARNGLIALTWSDYPFSLGTAQSLQGPPPTPIRDLDSRAAEQIFRTQRLAQMQSVIAYRNTVQGLLTISNSAATFGSGRPTFDRSSPGTWIIAIPIWQAQTALAIFVLLTLYLAWRTRPHPLAHHCVHCHYDLRGLADDARCPECGRGH